MPLVKGLGSHGEGVCTLDDGLTLFVEGALPGEEVEVEITQRKLSYAKGRLLNILKPSPDRVDPICPVFGKCGGCQLMHLSYEAQLKAKQQQVIDALQRIGHLDVPVAPCRPSPSPLAYRNKIQLPVARGKMGLYARGSHEVVPIKRCYVHNPLGEEIFSKIKPPEEARYVLIRTALATKQVLVLLVTSGPPPKECAEKIFALSPHIVGVVHNYNPHSTNRVFGHKFTILCGRGTIEEHLLGCRFRLSAPSFFQINPLQAEVLYARVLEHIGSAKTLLDAYCGVGTLSCLAAKQIDCVIGVECVPEAIFDARENAKLNQINNVTFQCAKIEDISLPKTEALILNPPRKGCDARLLEKIAAERIVYISCNPATLARDLAILSQRGYQIESVEPFDMFPQTSHVECVATLRRQLR